MGFWSAVASCSLAWQRLGGIRWESGQTTDDENFRYNRLYNYIPRVVNRIGYLPCFTPWLSGTVLSRETLFYTGFYVVVTRAFAQNWFDLDVMERGQWYTLLTYLSYDGPVRFSTLVVFPLGLFTSIVVNRAMLTYSTYNNLIRATLDAAVNLSTLIAPKDNSEFDDKLRELRATLVRLLMLGFRLSIGYIRMFNKDPQETEADLTDLRASLMQQQLVTNEEWELLTVDSKKHLLVYSWIAELAKKMMTHPKIGVPPPVYGRAHDKCCLLITLAEDLVEMVLVKIPYSYLALLTAIVRIYLLLISVQQGIFIGQCGMDYYLGHAEPKAKNIEDDVGMQIAAYGWVMLISVFFNGVLELYAQMDNPFRSHCLHVPVGRSTWLLNQNLNNIMYTSKAQLPEVVNDPWGSNTSQLPISDAMGAKAVAPGAIIENELQSTFM